MVQLEVLEEQQQQSRDALHDDLFVSVHVNAQFHALQNGDAGMEGKTAPWVWEQGGQRDCGAPPHLDEFYEIKDLCSPGTPISIHPTC